MPEKTAIRLVGQMRADTKRLAMGPEGHAG
jgi:hypothetical protein